MRSLETVNPERYIEGPQAYGYFKHAWNVSGEQDDLYQKILLEGPIRGRYIAVDHDKLAQLPDQDTLIEQFTAQAKKLISGAAVKALKEAALEPPQIGALVCNTCTGYLCPGLSSYLIEDLDFPASTKVFDLMGMGCGAAIPNLECAAALASQYQRPVLSIAVEICSATIFNSPDPGCIVSNCIFADGAAAAVISPDTHQNGALAKMHDFETGIFPQYRDHLKFVTDQGKLRNVLSRRVPVIGAQTISRVARNLLKRNNLSVGDIQHWAIHPGGTAVLEQVRKRLNLSDGDIRHSLDIFTHHGNMSSPSVMFVLRKILNDDQTRPGDWCCMLSFGAGFSAHAALVQIR